MVINIDKIKAIIWDLDDTLWEGTLSEGRVNLPSDRLPLLHKLVDGGIINCICSKNDEDITAKKLEEFGLNDCFVFNSINWDSKGQRIKITLKKMGLRPENALFIDDNSQNLKEAEFYNPGLMTALPTIIDKLKTAADVLQTNHNRMEQYRILEAKQKDAETYSSNEEFLRNSNIRVEICNDCESVIERLYELVKRTNQLNYTKYRPDFDTFTRELYEADNHGYIKVMDNYGYYGIVGFYMMKKNRLIHFLFSCRTIGVGVEQFVYARLGYPELETIGAVITPVTHHGVPDWITETVIDETSKGSKNLVEGRILIKGPCDLSSAIRYLNLGDSVDCEFTFTDDNGHLVESHNHSAHIYGSKAISATTLDKLIAENTFLNRENFNTGIFSGRHKMIILSTLIEGMYGLYKRKNTGEIIAFGHYKYNLTDLSCWDDYINQRIQTYGYKLTEDFLISFSNKYEYVGRTTPEMYINFLEYVLSNIPNDTHLCLILGSEIPYEAETDISYIDRHEFHHHMNTAIKHFTEQHSRVSYIELTKYIKSQADFTNSINHFHIHVYNSLAKDILSEIRKVCGKNVKASYSFSKWFDAKYLTYWRTLRYNLGQLLPKSLVSRYRKIRYRK